MNADEYLPVYIKSELSANILYESVPRVVKGADFVDEKGHAISLIVGVGAINSDGQ